MSEDITDPTDPEEYGQTELLDRPVDRVTPEFFRDIVDEYVDAGRLDGGVARFEVDGERERCFVVGEAVADLSETAYARAEIAELVAILDSDADLLDRPLELEIPVGDADRVVEEARSDGTVRVLFQAGGLRRLLETLQEELEAADAD